jgi:hypothetical protein
MLVILSVMSLVLGAIAVTLTALLRIERQAARDVEQSASHARLAALWRADAHASIAWQVKDDCTFQLADGRQARWWIDGASLRREVLQNGANEHRDSFELPAGARAAFRVEQLRARELAALSIHAAEPPHGYQPPARPLALTALVNLHGQPPAPEEQP